MTEQEMEEATNPFAGMNVEGAESSKGTTEEEKAEMQAVIDTDGDGVVSSEELDAAVDALAEIETDAVIDAAIEEQSPILNESAIPLDLPDGTSNPEVSSDPIPDTIEREMTDEEASEDGSTSGTIEIEYPSVKSLTKLIPPSQDEANKSFQQDWARHCIKWADENGYHFLGLSVKDGEPMFKEKK